MAMSSQDGAKAPFLNDYKLQFFQKRFPQTLTGGLRLNSGAPFYVYALQVTVFLWPLLFGGIFTALTEYEIIQDNYSCYAFGGFMWLTVTGVHLLRFFLARNAFPKGSHSSRHNVLADDDEIDFSSCFDIDTFLFIFPAKSYMLLHGAALAILCGMTFLYLLPSRLHNVGYDTGSIVVLLIFNWLTLCIASHSLTVQPPPETAIFRSLDDTGLNAFMRPFYTGSIALVGVLARHHSSLEEISKILYIVMAILPLLWTLGVLPPIDALFPWLAEQLLVFALGGTYMASDARLLVAFLLSILALIPACFIRNYLVLAIYSTAFGFLLSLDLFHIANSISNFATKRQPKYFQLTTVLKYLTLLTLCCVFSGLTGHFHGDMKEESFNLFGYVFLILFLFVKILGDLQNVYVGSGLIRNPLYIAKPVTSVDRLKNFQRKIGCIGHVYNVLLSYICPLLIVSFLGAFLNTSKQLSSFARALGTVRAFRWAWQSTFKCLLEVTVCTAINWMGIESAWWNGFGIGLQLMLIGIILDRLNELVIKTKFLLTMFITSWTEPKQRHTATIPTLTTSLILCPLLFAIVAASVLLSAPLTPFFCFPIFFIGFPRPKRMWPCLASQTCSESEGSVFYQQLVPKICQELQKAVASITIFTQSDFVVLRYQDRLILLHVLERGYRYCTLIARGLELEETSCHTVEAARVDDIFEDAFCKDRSSSLGLNSYAMHTLTPTNCLVVETYSDVRNILTGVIDQPENIERQSTNFLKCLIWVLLKNSEKDKVEDSSENTVEKVFVKLDKNEIMEIRENANLQTTQTVLCDDSPNEEIVKLVSVTQEKKHTPEKTLDDTAWSDKEWSDEKDSSDDETDFPNLETAGEAPPLCFGLPAQDVGSQTKSDSPQKSAKSISIFPSRKITPMASCVGDTPASQGEEQTSIWKNLLHPMCKRYLTEIQPHFPEEWFHCLSENVTKVEERKNEVTFKNLAMYCYAVINMSGLHGGVQEAGPEHINRVFQDCVPWSPELDLLEQDKELKELVLKAYRYAFKLTYDEAVLGAIDDNDELHEKLSDYEDNWFIGIENKFDWNDAILQEKANLFTIGFDSEKSTYTSHLLTKQELILYAGTLNSEAVNGQWSSLAFELLYLTNDDEERYSIQAHPVLLRNLTMQAADPPLGYAVYSSGPVHLNFGLI